MSWLATSIILSVVLTVVLNVGLRVVPRAGERLDRWMTDMTSPRHDPLSGAREPGVRVIFPWKAMLIGSLVLTVAVNLLILLF